MLSCPHLCWDMDFGLLMGRVYRRRLQLRLAIVSNLIVKFVQDRIDRSKWFVQLLDPS